MSPKQDEKPRFHRVRQANPRPNAITHSANDGAKNQDVAARMIRAAEAWHGRDEATS
jgi:hypothetical protein